MIVTISADSHPQVANGIAAKTVTPSLLLNPKDIPKKPETLQSKFTSPVSAAAASVKSLICTTIMSCAGLKKINSVWISNQTDFNSFELDEVFWFINTRKNNEMGVNTFIMTMISRIPRQIVAFNVDKSIKSRLIQQMVNSVSHAKAYYADGNYKYQDVDYFPGRLKQNFENKNDTHNIESTNSDLRHYIAGLHRKSRCFFRKLENLKTVLHVFINAYNKFGEAKLKYTDRQPPFSILDFL